MLKLFGPSRVAFRVLMIGMAVVATWLAARHVAARSGAWIAAAIAIQTAVVLQLQNATTGIGADLGFIALLSGVALAADRVGRWGLGRTFGIVLLGAAAIL